MDLLDNDFSTRAYTLILAEHSLSVPQYRGRVDFDKCRALMDMLSNLFDASGLAMQRACSSTLIKEAADEHLLKRVVMGESLSCGKPFRSLSHGMCQMRICLRSTRMRTP
jgi:hypothetical protein